MNNQARIEFALQPNIENQEQTGVGVTVENNYEKGEMSENMVSWVTSIMGCVESVMGKEDYADPAGDIGDATILLTEDDEQMNVDLIFGKEGVDHNAAGSIPMQLAAAVVEEFGTRMQEDRVVAEDQ